MSSATSNPSDFSISWVLFSFDGRIGRKAFWLSYPFLSLLGIMGSVSIELIDMTIHLDHIIVIFIISIPIAWISLAIQVKRWHDRNKSSSWVLLNFIPLIGFLWIIIELGFLRGTIGENNYGEDPIREDKSYNLVVSHNSNTSPKIKSKNKGSIYQKPVRTVYTAIKPIKNEKIDEKIDEKIKNDITVNENELYEKVWRDIEENKTDLGLWAKCFSTCEGDENKTKAQYVNKRVIALKEDIEKQLIDREIEAKKEAEKERKMVLVSQIKNNKLAILEGRTEDIEILSKTIKTMPNFFPDILDQFGYQLVQNKDREEMWSIHFPNGTGAQHIYNLHDLRTELRKIVEVNSQSMVVEGKSGTKTCPSCNLINSVAAARCDCGYNFTKRC